MSKTKSKGKQQLAKQDEETKDPIKILIEKPDDKIQQSDVHEFIERVRQTDQEFNGQFIEAKQKYHECFDHEIALKVKVGEAQSENEVVKETRAEVADKLHPLINKIRSIVADISKRKMAMYISNILRDVEGTKEASQKGISVSNITAILNIYTAKYGMIFAQRAQKAIEHQGGTLRTFDIKVEDVELLKETFILFNEAAGSDTFEYMKIIIDEHYDLVKFEIVTSGSEEQQAQ